MAGWNQNQTKFAKSIVEITVIKHHEFIVKIYLNTKFH